MSRSPSRRRRRGRSRPANDSAGNTWPARGGDATPSENGRVIEELRELSPFSVFCALYLGITETNGYQAQGTDAVARRFSLERDELAAYLVAQCLRREDLERASFDLEGARLDIRVAPDGISRVELARTMWKAHLDAIRS